MVSPTEQESPTRRGKGSTEWGGGGGAGLEKLFAAYFNSEEICSSKKEKPLDGPREGGHKGAEFYEEKVLIVCWEVFQKECLHGGDKDVEAKRRTA